MAKSTTGSFSATQPVTSPEPSVVISSLWFLGLLVMLLWLAMSGLVESVWFIIQVNTLALLFVMVAHLDSPERKGQVLLTFTAYVDDWMPYSIMLFVVVLTLPSGAAGVLGIILIQCSASIITLFQATDVSKPTQAQTADRSESIQNHQGKRGGSSHAVVQILLPSQIECHVPVLCSPRSRTPSSSVAAGVVEGYRAASPPADQGDAISNHLLSGFPNKTDNTPEALKANQEPNESCT